MMTSTYVRIGHDAVDREFIADALGEPWNGSAVPRWLRAEDCADVLRAVLAECGEVTHDADRVIVVHFLDETTETIERDADGYFTVDGWTFHPGHEHEADEDDPASCSYCGTAL